MTGEQVDVQVTVRTVMAQYKRDPLEVAFKYPAPMPPLAIEKREIDPNYVTVQLVFEGKENSDFAISMVLTSDHAKKLNLMVGDKLTLKLINEGK